MKFESNIGWCDVTANAVIGCSKVSPGCVNCYALNDTPARILRAKGIETWGPKGVRHFVAGFAEKVRRMNKLCICDRCREVQAVCREVQAVKWLNDRCRAEYPQGQANENRRCVGITRRIRCFADSNSDWLDDRWPVETLAAFLQAIHDAPNVDFLLLTKRPENWRGRVTNAAEHLINQGSTDGWLINWMMTNFNSPPKNVWLGVSAENQEYADRRIPELLKIPAAVRFVSAEPLLGPINFDPHWLGAGGRTGDNYQQPQIHWIVVGGESGKNRRYCSALWITAIADQCNAFGVPVWVKQHDTLKPGQQGAIPDRYWAMKETPK